MIPDMALVLSSSEMELCLMKCLQHRSLCWTFHPISVKSSQNSVLLSTLERLPFPSTITDPVPVPEASGSQPGHGQPSRTVLTNIY